MTEMDSKTRSEIDLAALRALCEPVVLAYGLELSDVEWSTGPAGRILRVTIERPLRDDGTPDAAALSHAAASQAGVTLEDCVNVSRDLSVALDVKDLVATAYHLEVSSPGADRPLRSARDFRRAVGHAVKLKLTRPARDGQRVLRGTLTSAGDAELEIEVDGNVHRVAPGDIAEARYVIEFGGAQKPKSARGKHKKKNGPARDAAGPARASHSRERARPEHEPAAGDAGAQPEKARAAERSATR